MKAKNMSQPARSGWRWAASLGLSMSVFTLVAAETNAPPATGAPAPKTTATNAPTAAVTNAAPAEAAEAPKLTPEQMFEGGETAYNNWIEFAAGGFVTSGNKGQFQQQNQYPAGAFGGISDFHFQTNLTKGTTLTLDGRGIVNNHDYNVSVGLQQEKVGYLKFSASEYRTWYNGDGGYWPPTASYYPLRNNGLGLDRGDFSVEAGLTLDKVPQMKFKYEHTTREGEKSSTIWGDTHPGAGQGVRGLSPSVYGIDEKADIFRFDLTHSIKSVDVGAGFSYETGRMTDALKIDQFPGEAIEQKVTDKQGTGYDMFNVHSFAESWVKKNVMLSAGFAFSDLDNHFSGSRNYGADYDVSYTPNAQNGFGYYGLTGSSHLTEYVGNVNLFTKPWQNFSIVPSVRLQQQSANANSAGTETLGAYAPVPFSGNSDRSDIDLRERLDLTYNGVTNWVFYGRAELTEGNGNLDEQGGLVPINGIGIPPIERRTDIDRFLQKYGGGVRWYPARRLTLDVGGYYKRNEYDYDHTLDSTPNVSTSPNRYPAYLVLQNFQTYDGNIRMTLRPRQNVTAVARYEYQRSTVQTRPDPVSGLAEVESSKTTSQIIGEDITWTPWTRLYLQAGLSYILNETKTPVSDYTQAVLPAQNDYWTVNFTSGLVLDDKTDLNVGFFYYRANDYQNNAPEGVPYGSGLQDYSITATLTRRITKNIRWALQYAYSHSHNEAFADYQDFRAHLIYSTLQYRF